jgi:hypothetical protein
LTEYVVVACRFKCPWVATSKGYVALLRGYHPLGHLVWPLDPKGERGEHFPRPLRPATGDPVAG